MSEIESNLSTSLNVKPNGTAGISIYDLLAYFLTQLYSETSLQDLSDLEFDTRDTTLPCSQISMRFAPRDRFECQAKCPKWPKKKPRTLQGQLYPIYVMSPSHVHSTTSRLRYTRLQKLVMQRTTSEWPRTLNDQKYALYIKHTLDTTGRFRDTRLPKIEMHWMTPEWPRKLDFQKYQICTKYPPRPKTLTRFALRVAVSTYTVVKIGKCTEWTQNAHPHLIVKRTLYTQCTYHRSPNFGLFCSTTSLFDIQCCQQVAQILPVSLYDQPFARYNTVYNFLLTNLSR